MAAAEEVLGLREVLPGTGESSWERERLLEALEAYRRGWSEPPLLRKWCGGGLALAGRAAGSVGGGTGVDGMELGAGGGGMAAGLAGGGGGVDGMELGAVGGGMAAGLDSGRAAYGIDAAGGRLGRDGMAAGVVGGRGGVDGRVGGGAAYGVESGGGRGGVGGKAAAGGGAAGAMTFVISGEEVDRHGDVVVAAGWQLAAYRQNPVFLWAHDYTRPVIGRALAVWPEPGLLLARMEFAPTEFASEVAALYRSGYQQGVSVGFRPLRYEERRQEQTGAFLGIRFLEQELLEVSAVPVPANRQALRRALEQAPRVGDYLCRAAGWGMELDPAMVDGVSPGLAAVLAEVRAGW